MAINSREKLGYARSVLTLDETAYGLKISKAKRIDDFSIEVTVETPVADNLKEFLDDHEEGDYRELDVMSIACKTDDAYVAALKAKMSK